MNPSQNDSFGSFSNGQGGDLGRPGVGTDGQGFSAVPMNNGVVTSGPVVSGPVTNSSIASGPVVLDSNGGRKSRKWVVILIILLLFVVVAGGVFAVWKSGVLGNDDSSLVYEYVNLLISGKDSKEKVDSEIGADILADEGEDIQNIYTSLRMFSYDSEENISYYNSLKNVLAKIEKAKNSSDGWKEIVSLANNSKELLSRYFVAAFLANTNASYNYYVKHKNFSGFLSDYDYPFAEPGETLVQEFDASIDDMVEIKKKMYEGIAAANCMENNIINYECLEMQGSEEILSLLLADAESSAEVYDVSVESFEIIIDKANNMVRLSNE